MRQFRLIIAGLLTMGPSAWLWGDRDTPQGKADSVEKRNVLACNKDKG